ncbi:MAG: SpoIID/LytB domain-containing protein [Armatimonadota bacterium]
MILKFAISTILLILTIIPSSAREIRVAVFRGLARTISIRPCVMKTPGDVNPIILRKTLDITNESGKLKAGSFKVVNSIKLIPQKPDSTITIFSKDFAQIFSYRGWIEVRPRSGGLLVINHIDIEDYLRGVLPDEMPQRWPFEAYTAQAIVARSYALANLSRHAGEGYDLCSLTHCQVYHGVWHERAETNNAVRATSGLVLAYQGNPIPAPYHSTCGGVTTDGLYDGHRKEPFLKPVSDTVNSKTYCATSPHFRWKGVASTVNIAEALRIDKVKTPLDASDMKILKSDASGRAILISLIGNTTNDVSGYDLMMSAGRHLGWQTIKSTKFSIRRSGSKMVFEGKGLGHGMGMCQWGARGMADKGHSFKEILKHYFPKCQILQLRTN